MLKPTALMAVSGGLLMLSQLTVGAPRADPLPSAVELTGLNGEHASLTLAAISALPHVAIQSKQHGIVHSFEGPLIGDLLKEVGAPSGKSIRGQELTDVIIVRARDGYAVALDLAGSDATMRPERVILADRVDGSPLGLDVGPLQLVVEGDRVPARSVLMVSSIALERLH